MSASQLIWLFFGFSGRISRAAYFLAGMLMLVTVVFLVYRMAQAQEAGTSGAFWETLLSGVFIASLWAQAALGAKRMHDLDKPGPFAAMLFVPLLNVIVFAALCLIPGNAGANRYGRYTNAPATA